jgi:hypothetical protein
MGRTLDALTAEYTEVTHHIDSGAVNWDDGDREGMVPITLPLGFVYFSHRIVESSGNGPRVCEVREFHADGIVVYWRVTPHGSFFDRKRAWMDVDVTVRGVKNDTAYAADWLAYMSDLQQSRDVSIAKTR